MIWIIIAVFLVYNTIAVPFCLYMWSNTIDTLRCKYDETWLKIFSVGAATFLTYVAAILEYLIIFRLPFVEV